MPANRCQNVFMAPSLENHCTRKTLINGGPTTELFQSILQNTGFKENTTTFEGDKAAVKNALL